jgi:HAD superfamily hydrolase (TIGR01662 family)
VSTLADLLARAEYLLLDFDGPICALFAAYPAREVVLELTKILMHSDAPIPNSVAASHDPFDVLRYAATVSPKLAHDVETHLRAREVEAAGSAAATRHADETIAAWRGTGRLVAIISNNSAVSVEAYLRNRGIAVDVIAARISADPATLKPSPHLIVEAMRELAANPHACALVGDSTTDISAAQRAGVRSIGYANKPGKYDALTAAGADFVIDDMQALVHTLAISPT